MNDAIKQWAIDNAPDFSKKILERRYKLYGGKRYEFPYLIGTFGSERELQWIYDHNQIYNFRCWHHFIVRDMDENELFSTGGFAAWSIVKRLF